MTAIVKVSPPQSPPVNAKLVRQFNIAVLSMMPMKNGTGNHYPYIVYGNGDGITEDMFPTEISNTNSWNIDIANALYKGNITRLQEIYEN